MLYYVSYKTLHFIQLSVWEKIVLIIHIFQFLQMIDNFAMIT